MLSVQELPGRGSCRNGSCESYRGGVVCPRAIHVRARSTPCGVLVFPLGLCCVWVEPLDSVGLAGFSGKGAAELAG
jgi:hypothetical protein